LHVRVLDEQERKYEQYDVLDDCGCGVCVRKSLDVQALAVDVAVPERLDWTAGENGKEVRNCFVGKSSR
jgi:hypothetical protein